MNLKNAFFLLFFLCISVWLSSQVTETVREMGMDPNESTVKTRFTPPKGYEWEAQKAGSFGEFLLNFPLHPEGLPIRDYKKLPVENQDLHVGSLKIDVGNRDLQQCADAWMRLYAEYLYLNKRYDEIGFHFTSGQFMSWNDYKSGIRTKEVGDRVEFIKSAKYDDSYDNFRSYLDLVFQYAGTISLDKESELVTKNEDIGVGDYLINPGSPGHTVIIIGIVRNKIGRRLYLLAESYMPAQDIGILKNRFNAKLSPWYELNVNSYRTITSKYIFGPKVIKRFHALK